MAENPCPVGCCAEIISGKWTLLMIRDLSDGSQRFCELERSLAGISPRTLSLRLRALEDGGIVERPTYPAVPPRVGYALTEKRRALVPMRDLVVREALKTMTRDAAKRFRELVAKGQEIPYDVQESGNGSPLPQYIPLTERFVRAQAPLLCQLDSFGSACAAIESADLAG